jgi:hypothetical protein
MCLDLLLGCFRALQRALIGGSSELDKPSPQSEMQDTEYIRPGENGESESIVDTKLDFQEDTSGTSTAMEGTESQPEEPKEQFKPVKVAKEKKTTTSKPVSKPKVIKDKREKVSIEYVVY